MKHISYGRFQLIDLAETGTYHMHTYSFPTADEAVRHLAPSCILSTLAGELSARLDCLLDSDIRTLHVAIEQDLLRRATLRLTS